MNKARIILGFSTIMLILFSSMMLERLYAAPTTKLTRTFSPVADSYVTEGYYAGHNWGDKDYLLVQSYAGQRMYTFIRFNLDEYIPPGSKVTSADLYLYAYFLSFSSPTSRRLYCNRVSGNWQETGITWNNMPGVSTDHVYYSDVSSIGWVHWTLTYWVQKFVAKDAASHVDNYGWRIIDYPDDSPTPYYIDFRSREYVTTGQRPSLQVEYYPPHLELSLSSSTIEAGNWVKMTVYRKTEDNEAVTRGDLEVDLSSSSTSANKKFSLTQGGAAITKLTIPDGSDHKDFYYYDDKAGVWDIHVSTDDYLYWAWSGSFIFPVANYGDDSKQLTVTPGPLDHFAFDTITSPKTVAEPFSITITAYDAYDNIKTDYTGTNSLSDTTGTINPTITGVFVSGKWTGMVTISGIGDNIKITTSGAGKTGESNLFNVRAGPPAKLVIVPSSFTMAAGVSYSYLNISLRDANNFETTHTSTVIVSLSTTSADGEFRQFETTTKITGVIIPAGSSSVKVDYYDTKGGTWTLTASATGLAPGTATVTVIPDTIPPVTTMIIGFPKYLSGTITHVSGSTVFELSATDDASGVKETRYRIDGGPWNTYTAGFTISTYSDGSHIIGYCSGDKAGNDEAEKTLTVMLDKTPPVVSGASPTGSRIQSSASVTFSVRVEDSGSGVKEVRLTVDGVSQGTMASGSDYSKTISLSEGSHTWSIEAVDNVDNAESWSGTFTLTVDTAPPTVSGLSAPSNPVFGESTMITCQVSDALSGVKEVNLYYSTNGGSSWTKAAMTLQGGVYTGSIPSQMFFTEVQYYVEAVDNVGNEARTPVSKYTVGIPIWLYAAVLALIVIIIAVMLLRRRKPSYAPTPLPPPPPPRV
ncbi:MAG: DNRLRE domain-containing protein [Thermoproteota archaeon]